MTKTSFIRWTLSSCAAVLMIANANAAIITADISYSGTGTFTAGETATGSGSATFNGQTLTAFTFIDTLTAGANSETYTYTLADVSSYSVGVGVTNFGNLIFSINAGPVTGSPNPFGATTLALNYSAANPGTGSTSGNASNLSQITSGLITVTQGSAVPEPSSLYLIGLSGVGLVALRRFRRS